MRVRAGAGEGERRVEIDVRLERVGERLELVLPPLVADDDEGPPVVLGFEELGHRAILPDAAPMRLALP